MRVRTLATLTLPLAFAASVLTTAQASASSDVRASGTCSATTTWKLKAKPDNGRLEVELEVDSNRAGQTWSWTLADNGAQVSSGTGTTVAPSGSFEVRRRIANLAGVDTITAQASSAATGEVCAGSLRI
jgi:hypothetical protein